MGHNLLPQHEQLLDGIWNHTVGVNIGKGFVKMWCGNQELPETASVVALVTSTIDYDEYFRDDDMIIEYQDRFYAIGKAASRLGVSAQPDLSDDRLLSNDYLLLLLAGLSSFHHAKVYEPERVIVIVPLSSYNNDKEMIKRTLQGQHEIGIVKGGNVVRRMTIILHEDRLGIVPEGYGTLSMLTISPEGIPFDPDGYGNSRIGVLNGGTGTCEALGFENMKPVKSMTDKTPVGLYKVWKGIIDFAAVVHNFTMDNYEANRALKDGFFYVGHQKVYIHRVAPAGYVYSKKDDPDLRNTLIGEQAKQIGNMVSTVWQGGKLVRAIPFSGGSAEYMEPFLRQRFDHIFVVPNPVQAEAYGAFLYGIFKAVNEAGFLKAYMG